MYLDRAVGELLQSNKALASPYAPPQKSSSSQKKLQTFVSAALAALTFIARPAVAQDSACKLNTVIVKDAKLVLKDMTVGTFTGTFDYQNHTLCLSEATPTLPLNISEYGDACFDMTTTKNQSHTYVVTPYGVKNQMVVQSKIVLEKSNLRQSYDFLNPANNLPCSKVAKFRPT